MIDPKDIMKVNINDFKQEDSTKVRIEFDPLEELHQLCNERADDFGKRMLNGLLHRYCGVCFFGKVKGFLGNIPVCKDCFNAIVGENPSIEQMQKATSDIQKFAMRSRDAFECLWMKMDIDLKKNEK